MFFLVFQTPDCSARFISLPFHFLSSPSGLHRSAASPCFVVPDYVFDQNPPLMGSALSVPLQRRHSSLATAGCCPATGRGWRSCSCSSGTRETADVCIPDVLALRMVSRQTKRPRQAERLIPRLKRRRPRRVQNTSTTRATCSRHSQFFSAVSKSATPSTSIHALYLIFHVIVCPPMSCSGSIAHVTCSDQRLLNCKHAQETNDSGPNCQAMFACPSTFRRSLVQCLTTSLTVHIKSPDHRVDCN